MIIDCVADLHGHYPKLEGGDLLIVAGDLTRHDDHTDSAFDAWLWDARYKKKIVIAGNHDNSLQNQPNAWRWFDKIPFTDYLCDSGTEFEDLKIWGSPWTKTFEGMNPHCKAFTADTEEELAEKWALIPDDVDILVTHSPPKGFLDYLENGKRVGSESLFDWWYNSKILLKLWVCGHIHESYGRIDMNHYRSSGEMTIINASHVNEHYQPVNKPIRIEL